MSYQFSRYETHYRNLTYLGVPIIIGQLGNLILNFADTLMIGHHSTKELAAAAFVNNMFTLVIIFASLTLSRLPLVRFTDRKKRIVLANS